MSLDILKQKTTDELVSLHSLNIKNYTDENKQKSIDDLDPHFIDAFNRRVKPFIYNPQTIREIEELEVKLDIADLNDDLYFTSVTMLSSHSVARYIPGCFMVWFVKEKNTDKFIGLLGLSSDFNSLKPRDDEIGWTKETEFGKLNRLQNVVQLKTDIPFQPFGYNALGGKLIAKLCHSKEVIDKWEKKFKQYKVVLLTTTSLFGSYCQYSRLPDWKKLKPTSGERFVTLSDELIKAWENEYRVKSMTTSEEELIQKISKLSAISITEFQHGHERGCFFCSLYDNYKDFLCGKISEDKLTPNKNRLMTISDALNEWKPLAIKRMENLIKEKKLQVTATFYDSLRTKPLSNPFFSA